MLLVGGCTGERLDLPGETDAAGPPPASSSDAGTPAADQASPRTPSVDAAPTTVTPSSVPPGSPAALAQAQCNDPTHGPVQWFKNAAELSPLLVGRWYACAPVLAPGDSFQDPFQQQGVEFFADGTWRGLVVAADGTLTDDAGLFHQGTWAFSESGVLLRWLNANWGGNFGLAFESAPRRVFVADDNNSNSWLVPL